MEKTILNGGRIAYGMGQENMEIEWNYKASKDFPGGPVVNSPPARAENMGLISGPGRFHMPWGSRACVPQLLGLFCRAHEPQLLNLYSATTEACVP